MVFIPKRSLKVRTRLGLIATASISAILLIGVIAWYGFKSAHIQITTFQIENIPQLKSSLNLSELGTALEAFSLTIPSATNRNQLDFHRESLKIRISEIESLFKKLLIVHQQILLRDPNNYKNV
jgi:phosphoglycerate-specific signal transduction histidine kinase